MNRVRKIAQVDNHVFSILWSDGKEEKYRLCDLQRRCPCAGCLDEVTGKRKVPLESIPDDLRAVRIISVGRYAIKVFFESGCSRGIYHFEDLRKFKSCG